MRKAIEGCLVSVLLVGCNGGLGDDVPRHGETETHGSSSGSESSGETTAASETGGDGGCVLTQGYWKNHNASSEHPHNQIAWPIPEDTALCDSTWLEILWTPPKHGNAWLILAHQWIAARLNVAAGAAAPDEVGAAIDEAGSMLEGCTIADGDRDHALELADMLDGYNNGMMGTDHCGDDDDDDGDDGDDDGDDDDDDDDDGDDDDDDDDDGHDDACDDDDDGGGTTGDDAGGTTGDDGDEGCDACTTTDGGGSSTSTSSSGGTSMSSSGG